MLGAIALVLLMGIGATLRLRTSSPSLQRHVLPAVPMAVTPRVPLNNPPSVPRQAAAVASPEAAVPPPPAPPAPSSVTSTNAALLYQQAFALLSSLDEDDLKRLKAKEHAADQTEALSRKLKPIVALARAAADLPYCDWGLGDMTLDTPLPHLDKARTLADALLWDAACGDAANTGDDLIAALTLGEQVSDLLIGHLVSSAIQNKVLDLLSERAANLPAEALQRMTESLTDRHYEESLYRAILSEAQMLDHTAEHYARLKPERAQQLVDHTTADADLPSQTAQVVMDAWRVTAQLERDYAEAMFAADANRKRLWQDALETAARTHPLISSVIPSLSTAEAKSQCLIVKRAMAAAAIALRQGDPAALEVHPDPWTGQPFACTQTADGLELRSGLEDQGRPVIMVFRNP